MTRFTQTNKKAGMKMSNTNNENKTLKKAKKARVIPGFGLTMGVTVTMLSLIVLIPLASVYCSIDQCCVWADHCMGTCKI